eukprot:TRINITY_DN40090_c0_g1_i1.p1 TRINITY_DN40090_c0_g1~~TRINITY_DN40090_c0_g1_i1.p1  ORF type:complete len:230 (-),score=19.91 TRINITY_DN40090_c0_g1_i1:228-848(-)
MDTELTLCLRNLPCKILEDDFGHIMFERGLDVSSYSLHFPKRKGRRGQWNNFGYGFVTCWRDEDADVFVRLFQDYRFEGVASAKTLRIELGTASQVGNQIGEATQPWNAYDSSMGSSSETPGLSGNRVVSQEYSHSGLDLGESQRPDLADVKRPVPASEDVPATRLFNPAHGLSFEEYLTSMCHQMASCSSDQSSSSAQEQMLVWQ